MSDDSQEKSFEATDHKLDKAREKGQAPKSKEVSNFVVISCLLVYVFIFYASLNEKLAEFVNIAADAKYSFLIKSESFLVVLSDIFWSFIFPLYVLIILVNLIVSIGFSGFVFSFEPLKPKVKKINPVENLKNIFKKKNLIEFIFNFIKTMLVASIVTYIVMKYINDALNIVECGKNCFWYLLQESLKEIIIAIVLMLAFYMVVDLIVQKKLFLKEMKMSQYELKQETKDTQGSPEAKSEIRRQGNELLNYGEVLGLSSANFVITDNNGVAVALSIKQDKMPVVVGKADKSSIKNILAYGRSKNMKIVNNAKIAKELFDNLKIGEPIPVSYLTSIVGYNE
ncbi:EscU/YscU/HrcU family type III secretion system export apparatus switch protein [Endozoicomonas sp. SM1973]|uniref:Flagellar biosynthetic protein FlhB n=1 Tax=Spartinivicinus marinus TaxID=2994442 RepID=A0A853I4C8_9GAMM|nr:EscU/YscU/HrcU family type III secretion system export apparatus switch protein [Spartinivicinus marinus]MCX4029080.1 EscU/YscU/HrcU family type III secretion system export apparatus switch protein [Spartinivicinus marinus]NYZ68770.1 EscU/YscU/HrcU family type III secretion system export apparatus switch protein [Spartinivicinus marinus]